MNTTTPTLLNVALSAQASVWGYVLVAAVGSLSIRALLSFLRAFDASSEAHSQSVGVARRFWVAFRGHGDTSPIRANDYWQTCFLGFLELAAFPVLFAIEKPEYAAGWFALKTLSQWSHWSTNRNIYNRFLIGNALVLLLGWFMARFFFV